MTFERPTLVANTKMGWKEILIYTPAFLIVMVGSAIGFFWGALGVSLAASLFFGGVADSVYLSLAVVLSGGLVGATITGFALSLVSFALTNFLTDKLNKRTP
ncbi:MAG: hypothetical protein ACE5JU_16025 [Candidatus Binatia bacterium]